MTTRQHVLEQIRRNVSLRDATTFKLGGPAEYFVEVDDEAQLLEAVKLAREWGMPWFLLGGGSNLVVSDAGVDGLVIRNRAKNHDYFDPVRGCLTLSSGLPLRRLVEWAVARGFKGLDCFAGIPGTIGGAVYGNAGAYGRSMADIVAQADILTPDGHLLQVGPEFFRFDYRTSFLKQWPAVVLNVTFRVEGGGDPALIQTQVDEIVAQRHAKHPPRDFGCAGSFFKNLDPSPGEARRRAAGEVLEKAGAKTMQCGGAAVYEKHANFIINQGQATAADVRRLATMLKERVAALFSIDLSEEVLYVGRT
jgi:UDP-N-acetylmuramate dehydrogenase